MKPTVAIVLDTRRMSSAGKNAGKYQIKIRVTFKIQGLTNKWIQKYYQTKYYATPEEFKVITAQNEPRNKNLAEIRYAIKAKENDALEKINKHDITTQQHFEVYFLSSGNVKEIDGLFNEKIKELESEDQISTAEKYTTAITVIKEFAGGPVTWGEVNEKWLKRWQKWYCSPRKKIDRKGKEREIPGRSLASFAFHARALRNRYKAAIEKRLIDGGNYPFGPGKFVIPSVRRPLKRFLTPEEKDLFINYKPTDDRKKWYHDLWVFSYYCNGMNFADIANLKRKDIFEDYILFDRHKTRNTDTDKLKIIVPLSAEIKAIIARQGNKTLDPNAYVFPILKEGMTVKEKFKTVRKLVLITNRVLDVIRLELGIKDKVTTYTARHTFSNQLINAGESTEMLQVLLGHKLPKTTENYKAGFALDKIKKAVQNL
jgi:integrase/recombinase XerD